MPQAADPTAAFTLSHTVGTFKFRRWDCTNSGQRKRSRAPVRSRHVPLSRPQPPQTAAKVRGFSPTAPGFTAETDSPLEGAGFEPSVPGYGGFGDTAAPQPQSGRRPATPGRGSPAALERALGRRLHKPCRSDASGRPNHIRADRRWASLRCPKGRRDPAGSCGVARLHELG